MDMFPDDFAPWYYLGETYYAMGNYSESEKYFLKAFNLNATHAWTNYYLSLLMHADGELQKAIFFMDSAIKFHPGQPYSWIILLSSWQMEMGQPNRANSTCLMMKEMNEIKYKECLENID
jgi:tetratricopeptide (TPR) repeat protein